MAVQRRTPRPATAALALAATGVVFGDIGTSPIYAFREAIGNSPDDPATAAIGTASLVVWTITLVVTVKYVMFVMRADNDGEGGILALLALLRRWVDPDRNAMFGATARRTFVMLVLVAGAALLFGDGSLTPAISVLSAVEGLEGVAPRLADYAVPISVVILLALFAAQSRGTGRIGRIFGPVMVLWFATIGLLGAYRIIGAPQVLQALLPHHAVEFLIQEGWRALPLLSLVFLSVTGAEALYADIGNFGVGAIRVSWYVLVMPALLLCYLGQAALVLADPAVAASPFFGLAPGRPVEIAMVVLATLATVIASQALITGAFSLAQQAIQLRLLPMMHIRHTSADEEGQIYVPAVNLLLGAATLALTVGFGSSARLANAYGFAVAGTMVATTTGFLVLARTRWQWPAWKLLAVVGTFAVVDLTFFAASFGKVLKGGFVSVLMAGLVFGVMVLWRRGQFMLRARVRAHEPSWQYTLHRIKGHDTTSAKSVGVFLNSTPGSVPHALTTLLGLTHSIPRTILVVTVITHHVPYLPADMPRVRSETLGRGVWRVIVNSGFMESLDLPAILRSHAGEYPFPADDSELVYFVSTMAFKDDYRRGPLRVLGATIYDFLQRNAATPTDYFRLPASRVISIGTHVEL